MIFAGNSAGSRGGGIYNSFSNPTLSTVTISGNTGKYYGGGMFNYDDISPTLTNVILWGNIATTTMTSQ